MSKTGKVFLSIKVLGMMVGIGALGFTEFITEHSKDLSDKITFFDPGNILSPQGSNSLPLNQPDRRMQIWMKNIEGKIQEVDSIEVRRDFIDRLVDNKFAFGFSLLSLCMIAVGEAGSLFESDRKPSTPRGSPRTAALVNAARLRYASSIEEVNNRRQAWGEMSELVDRIFELAVNEVKKQPFFDALYHHKTSNTPTSHELSQSTHLNIVTLYFGKHPTGIIHFTYGPGGKIRSASHEIESGGSLTFSQSPSGDVVVILCACNSEVLKTNDPFLIYKIFQHPSRIHARHVERAIRVFFWYNRVTSFISPMTLADAWWVKFYKFRTAWHQANWPTIILNAFIILGVIAGTVACVFTVFPRM